MKIKLVVATKFDEQDFYQKSATGQSIVRFNPNFVELILFNNNNNGLSRVYNQAIRQPEGGDILMVFMHDDVHILDYFWFYRVQEALENFDVIGVVGNKLRRLSQPSWAFKNIAMEIDSFENFSGVISHGKVFPPSKVDLFGQTRQEVKLIDGVFIAAKRNTLIDNNIFFDERFDFHFYDVDFCRQVEAHGLSIGTWDIALMHESGGNYSDKKWCESYYTYINKWGG